MSLILGFDAGGTFTDSVIFNSVSKKVISEGKALTTNHDLSKGIKNSIEISLDKISLNDQKNIKLVVVSSTLATNSVVNSTGCRVGLILVGFLIYEPLGLYGRWLKIRLFFDEYPLYRKATYKRQRAFLQTERLK